MSPRTRIILIVVALMALLLVVAGISYVFANKFRTGPSNEPPPPPSQEEISKKPKMGRFNIGEFISPSRDEELHYIKVEVEVGYLGTLDKELEERKGELRDAITRHIMKLTIQRAKEDYVDGFLHKDIEKKLNEVLGTSTSESRIIQVWIPSFIIN